MKAGKYYGGKDLRVELVPDPVPAVGEVLIRVTSAGICGSDLHGYREEYDVPPGRPALIMGHEVAGVVAALGERVVSGLQTGQRVGINPLVGCGRCERCRAGMSYLCFNAQTVGYQRSGGFAEYTTVPQENCYPLPEEVPDDAAVLLDVYGCALHGLTRAPVKSGDRVAVIGTGAMGIAFAEMATLAGASSVAVIGRRKQAVETAANLAHAVAIDASEGDPVQAVKDWTKGRGADVVYECVGGTEQTLALAMQMACQGGVVGVEGVHMRPQTIDSTTALLRELTVTWFYSHSRRGERAEYEIALDLITQGKLQAARLITHHYPLDRISEAFSTADNHAATGSIKVVVVPVYRYGS
jgi:2-desacetyl-2-hydroxyethyl bacteriochlorophyllide A dehydrogenase